MNVQAINCAACRQPLPDNSVNTGMQPCRYCGKTLSLSVYPALFREADTATLEPVAAGEGEAGCFYHAEKMAVAHCEVCGRFVCDLCRVDINNQCICPNCIQSRAKKNKIESLENKRLLPHRVAWLWLILGLPMFMLLFGSVVGIYYSLKALKLKAAPYSQGIVVERFAAVSGILFGVVELIGGLLTWGKIYYG